ncbi:hypothetical protein, no similarity [Maudiozyma saulgeensis]|uniref:Uncharacterized protein n=1 Tax=Maudiozyma saulgeensis TaxID=1789683 RepID=A0A1X7R001_9SACH|nr:hypothetical protein, no similarity [Kazachstania saulgeensis]
MCIIIIIIVPLHLYLDTFLIFIVCILTLLSITIVINFLIFCSHKICLLGDELKAKRCIFLTFRSKRQVPVRILRIANKTGQQSHSYHTARRKGGTTSKDKNKACIISSATLFASFLHFVSQHFHAERKVKTNNRGGLSERVRKTCAKQERNGWAHAHSNIYFSPWKLCAER